MTKDPAIRDTPGPQPVRGFRDVWDLGFILLVSFGIFLLFDPWAVLTPGAPVRGDLPGHLALVEFLRMDLLPAGRFRGWSFDWFAGFPAFYFYFPLPSLLAAGLGCILDPGLALKIVALVAPLSLPWALLLLARQSGLGRWARWGIVLGGGLFLLSSSFNVLGGNLLSTAVGEYSYGWGLTFSLLYLGVLGRVRPTTRDGYLAGVLLAAATLSHVLPAMAVATGTVFLLAWHDRRKPVALSWLVAFLLSGFWTLPMILNLAEVGDRGWEFVPGITDVLPAEVYLILPLAGLGLWLNRRRVVVWALLVTGIVALAVALIPQSHVMRGRLIPLWILTVNLFAGLGVGAGFAGTIERFRSALVRALALGLLLLPWTLILASRGLSIYPSAFREAWVGPGESGGSVELERIVSRLGGLPSSRVHWEDGEELNREVGPLELSLIPIVTHQGVLQGILNESAPLARTVEAVNQLVAASPRLAPFPQEDPGTGDWDPARAVPLLRGLGTRYFLAASGPTISALGSLPDLMEIGRFSELVLFDLGTTPLVSPLGCELSSPSGSRPFKDEAREWFLDGWKGRAWLVDVPRDAVDLSDCRSSLSGEGVAAARLDGGTIRFRTSQPGVPHLIRASFFPNWRAQGAKGPFRAAPWFMVVVPEAEEVELSFQTTWKEVLGWAVTAVGVSGILAFEVVRRKQLESGA